MLLIATDGLWDFADAETVAQLALDSDRQVGGGKGHGRGDSWLAGGKVGPQTDRQASRPQGQEPCLVGGPAGWKGS